MKFTASKSDLIDSAAWVAKSLPKNPLEPIYTGVTIAVHKSQVTFSCFDSDVSAKSTIDVAVSTPGEITVSGRLLAEIIKTLPDDDVTIEQKDHLCLISCKNIQFNLPIMHWNNSQRILPVLPKTIGSAPLVLLRSIAKKVAFAAATNKDIVMLHGMKIEFYPDHLTFVATDRFRLSVYNVPWQARGNVPDDVFAIVSAERFTDPVKNYPSTAEDITISLDYLNPSVLGLSQGLQESTARLLPQEWVNYRRLIPTNYATVIHVDKQTLSDAIKRASLVADSKSPKIILTIEAGTLTVASNGVDGESGKEKIEISKHGKDIIAAFDTHYLADAVSVFDTGTITLLMNGETKPAVFVAGDDLVEHGEDSFVLRPTDFLHLVMPTRII